MECYLVGPSRIVQGFKTPPNEPVAFGEASLAGREAGGATPVVYLLVDVVDMSE